MQGKSEEVFANESSLPGAIEERFLHVGGKVVQQPTLSTTPDLVPKYTVEFPTAAKVVAYRVRECGIRYGLDEGDDEYAGADMQRRNAVVALAARLVDAKTGRVEESVSLRETQHDYVPEERQHLLERQLYRSFNSLHPTYRADGRPRPELQQRIVQAKVAPELVAEEGKKKAERPMGPKEAAIMKRIERDRLKTEKKEKMMLEYAKQADEKRSGRKK